MSNPGLVVAMRRRRLEAMFRRASATSPDRAQALSALGSRGGFAFRRLVARGVLVATEDGRYWLDETASQRDRRRRRGIIMTVIGIVGALVAWVLAAG